MATAKKAPAHIPTIQSAIREGKTIYEHAQDVQASLKMPRPAATSKQSAARAAFIERSTIANTVATDPVAQARAELQAAGDSVKVASRALVLAQRRHEDARVGFARAIEDRCLLEGV